MSSVEAFTGGLKTKNRGKSKGRNFFEIEYKGKLYTIQELSELEECEIGRGRLMKNIRDAKLNNSIHNYGLTDSMILNCMKKKIGKKFTKGNSRKEIEENRKEMDKMEQLFNSLYKIPKYTGSKGF